MENNRTYFSRRAAQERSAASHAEGKARQAHEQMAEHYSALAEAAGPAEPPEPTEAVEPTRAA